MALVAKRTFLVELAHDAAAQQNKPLFLGEFSVQPATAAGPRTYVFAEDVLDWLVASNRRDGGRGGGLLASVWVFEYLPQNHTFSVIPGRDAMFLLKLQLANRELMAT